MHIYPPSIGINGLYFQQDSMQWSELNKKNILIKAGAHLRWASSAYVGHPVKGYDLLIDGRDDAPVFFAHETLDCSDTTAGFSSQSIFTNQVIQSFGGRLPIVLQYKGQKYGAGLGIVQDAPLDINIKPNHHFQGVQLHLIGADLELEQKTTQLIFTYSGGQVDRYTIDLHFLEQRSFFLPTFPDLQQIRIESPGCQLIKAQFFQTNLDESFLNPDPNQQLVPGFNISADFATVQPRINYPGNQFRQQDADSFELLYDHLVDHSRTEAPILEEIEIGSNDRSYYTDVEEEGGYYVMNPQQLLAQCTVDAEMARALGMYTILEVNQTVPYASYLLRAKFEDYNLKKDGQAIPIHCYAFAPPLIDEQQVPVLAYDNFQIIQAVNSGEKDFEDVIGNKVEWSFNFQGETRNLPILARLTRIEKARSEQEEPHIIDGPLIGIPEVPVVIRPEIDPPVVIDPGFEIPVDTIDPILDFPTDTITPEIDLPGEVILPEIEVPGGIVFKPYDYRKQILISVDETVDQGQAEFWDTFQPIPEELKLYFDYSIQGFDVWGRANAPQTLAGEVFYQPIPQALENTEMARGLGKDGKPNDQLQGAFYWRKNQCEADHKVDHFELLFSADRMQGISVQVTGVQERKEDYLLRLDLTTEEKQALQSMDHYFSFAGGTWAEQGSSVEADERFTWQADGRLRIAKQLTTDFSSFGLSEPSLGLIPNQPSYLKTEAEQRFLNQSFQFKVDLKVAKNWTTARKSKMISVQLNQPLIEEGGSILVFLAEHTEQVFIAFEDNKIPFGTYQITQHTGASDDQFRVAPGSIVQHDKEYRLEAWLGNVPKGWNIDKSYQLYVLDELYDDVIYYIPDDGAVVVYPKVEFLIQQFKIDQVSLTPKDGPKLHLGVRARDEYLNWSVVGAPARLYWLEYEPGKLGVTETYPTEEDALRKLKIPVASYPNYFGKSQYIIQWKGDKEQYYTVYRATTTMLLAEAEEQLSPSALGFPAERLALETFRNLEEWQQYEVLIHLAAKADCNDAFSQITDQELPGAAAMSFVDDAIDGYSTEIYLYKVQAFSAPGVASPLSPLIAMAKSPAIPSWGKVPTPLVQFDGQVLEVELPQDRPNAQSYYLLLEDEIKAEQVEKPNYTFIPTSPFGSITLPSDLQVPETPTLAFFTGPSKANTEKEALLDRIDDYPWQHSRHIPLTNMQPKPLSIEDGWLDLGFLRDYRSAKIVGLYLNKDLPTSIQQDLGSLQAQHLSSLVNHIAKLGEGGAPYVYEEVQLGNGEVPIAIQFEYLDVDGNLQNGALALRSGTYNSVLAGGHLQSGKTYMYRLLPISDDGLHTGEPGEAWLLKV
ncbi:MAG: hypothetical protein AAF242_00860 [Bacteroidota bacterium]